MEKSVKWKNWLNGKMVKQKNGSMEKWLNRKIG